MNAARSDRRVTRTKRRLHEAVVSLLLERGWDHVSVRDICERARCGRSTFYVHFADKEDLLLSGFEQFQHELERHVEQAGHEPLAFLEPLIAHVHSHQGIARALVGKRSSYAVRSRLSDVIRVRLEHDLATVAPPGPHSTATLHYLAGAFVGVLSWWLDSRTHLPNHELEHILRDLTTPLFAELSRERVPR